MMIVSTSYVGYAQGKQPPVTEIYKNYDGNKDGMLEANELTGSRYARPVSYTHLRAHETDS